MGLRVQLGFILWELGSYRSGSGLRVSGEGVREDCIVLE